MTTTVPIGPDLKDRYPAQYATWVAAGGEWRNFASFLVATGQIQVSDADWKLLVKDRLVSSIEEFLAWFRATP